MPFLVVNETFNAEYAAELAYILQNWHTVLVISDKVWGAAAD